MSADGREETASGGQETSIDSFLRAVGRAPEIAIDTVQPPLAPGAVLAETFRIERELGRGGMGVVFEARDLHLERDVAIKVMRADRWPLAARPRLAEIFDREAKATARLNHPGIVTLYGAGHADGVLYLVLERLRGHSLTGALRGAEHGLPTDRALRITRDVAAALVHAHAQGILHRDLKPQNVFVTDDDRVKLLDFGLASLDAALGGGDAAGLGMSRAGTPAYMAPEQWRGDAQDERTDVWAAGVLLYQLVTGGLPFAPGGADELERALPIAVPDAVPAAIAQVIARAVAWRPDDRYRSAAELLAALDQVIATRAPLPDARVNRARTRRVALSIAVAALAAIVVVGARRVVAGGAHPPAIAEGEWRPAPSSDFAPSTWHGVVHKLDDTHYRIINQDAPWGTAPNADTARNDGVYELHRVGDAWHLSGDARDVAGWCCDAYGHVEYEVGADGRLQQIEADWGDRPGHYLTRYGPWWFERIGPLPANAP